MYWKEIRSEAWARTKQGLGSGYRLVTSIVLPILGFLTTYIILREMTITIPITLIVGVSVTVSLYLLFVFGEWCTHVIALPAEKHAASVTAIRNCEND